MPSHAIKIWTVAEEGEAARFKPIIRELIADVSIHYSPTIRSAFTPMCTLLSIRSMFAQCSIRTLPLLHYWPSLLLAKLTIGHSLLSAHC